MKLTLAQLNPTIGDFSGNLRKIEKTLIKAHKDHSDLAVFSELFLTGYPPLDLLERRDFIDQTYKTLNDLLALSKKIHKTGILCGTITKNQQPFGKGLYNSALLIQNGKILFQQHKSLLPTYDVFDEARYFDPASTIEPFQFNHEKLGISICEDAWNVPEIWHESQYQCDPVQALARNGTTLFINISASPFQMGKEKIRYQLIQHHAMKYQRPFIFLNQVAGNDELVFDGRSFILDHKGRLICRLSAFQEEIHTIDLNGSIKSIPYSPDDDLKTVYEALLLGIRDYIMKCGFKKVVVGLSGGIDSAVVCCLASRSIGSENVLGVAMPSPFSSESSTNDAKSLAKNLGIRFTLIPITSIYHSYLKTLASTFKKKSQDITEENIQARIRGNILMALSNKLGYLTLSTGNKSELSVGYCTLYGDMSGGLSVIGDIPKTMVYQIAEYINKDKEIIPKNILTKSPSAELKHNQKDQDTLPPYEELDTILHLYIDRGLSENEIIKQGMNPETVQWTIRAIIKNEYKRRQSAPVLKVTSKAFGMGRRMPIAIKQSEYWQRRTLIH